MSTPRGQLPERWRRLPGGSRASLVTALTPGLALALALTACGSSPASAAATKKACEQIGAVLSDGPDPDADPAGYAEAQILPLSQIHAPGQRLRNALRQLDAAYRQVFASNGASADATRAVAAATRQVSKICPGTAS